jgi:hypothetical protein
MAPSSLGPGGSSTLSPDMASRRSALVTRLTQLGLDDRFVVERALASSPATMGTHLAAYAFAPHMIWHSLFRYWWADCADHLCLFAEHEHGMFMVLPPLGPGPLSRPVREGFAMMRERNRGTAVSRVENVPEALRLPFENLGYLVKSKAPDYLYRATEVATLSGERYKSQRGACNRLEKTSQIQYAPFAEEDRVSCQSLFHVWVEQKAADGLDAIARQMLVDGEAAHTEAFEHGDQLGLTGRVLRIDGTIRGYTFGYERSPAVFCVLLEVADRRVHGAAQVLFREYAREAVQRGYEFVNTMDAFGLPRLAHSKQAYRPVALIDSYLATER